MSTARFVVHGRVQGVGFRWFVREQARQLRLGGWVRNLGDGSVEVSVAGDDGAIDQLRQALATGPVGAHVTGVDEPPGAGELPVDPQRFTVIR